MAFLQITLKLAEQNHSAAAAIYQKYRLPFLDTVPGARSKQLLLREEDVQVLHGFATTQAAQDYLASELFNQDVVTGIAPLLQSEPQGRIYEVA